MTSRGKKNPSVDSSPMVEQLSQTVADLSLDAAQDDGPWEEVTGRKSKNRAGYSIAKPWVSQNSNAKSWGGQGTVQKVGMQNHGGLSRTAGNAWATQGRPTGRGSTRTQSSNRAMENNYSTPQPTLNSYIAPPPAVPPPLENGWNWQSKFGSTAAKASEDGQKREEAYDLDKKNEIDDEDDDIDDSDDELLSDDYDSDSSEKSHETRKKSRWFRKFFESLDSLTNEEINEPARQWHCPACQNGPGAIDWYRGLQPLMTHAKTKGAKRVKLHRELAELLDEELHRRGTSVIPSGEVFGKWKGLKAEETDREIVWPPMVMIVNTQMERGDDHKWKGMGNQELLDYFSGYSAAKAKHSYGPSGHRGISLLIFEASPVGYYEAERLHNHFKAQGTDRDAWDHRPVLFLPGGKRQLYGYLAEKGDLDIFNQHCQAKSKLKFELRSFNEVVVNQLTRISEENHLLAHYKSCVAKEQRRTRTLEESLAIVSDKLRKTAEENRIVRQRTQEHHQQSQEELDFQEEFFKDQLRIIHEKRNAKEENFERLQLEERERAAKQLGENPSNTEEYEHSVNKIEKLILVEDSAYEAERDVLVKEHDKKFAAMKKRHQDEELELEKEYDAALASLMKKFSPEGATKL